MNKESFKEYQRLDLLEMENIDRIRSNKNTIWRKKNEILKLQQDNAKYKKATLQFKKQKYNLMGRTWIDLEEDEK